MINKTLKIFDVIDFKVFKKKTGKVSHQYTINDQPFLRHKVQKSGKSYFKCSESGCKATLHVRYTSFEAAQTEEEPIIER